MTGDGRAERLQSPFLGYFGKRAEVILTGTCAACGKEAALAAFDAREWVRLGPLPVWPLATYRVFDVCPLCLHEQRYPLDKYRVWAEDQAEPELEALRADPQALDKRLDLAWQYYGLGLMYEALAALAPLLATGQVPAAVHHAAGVLYRALRRPEAAEAFRRAVAAEPRNTLYRLDLGRVLMRDRRTEADAEQQLARVVELAPEDLDAWVALAQVRTHRGRWPLAWQAWQQALALDPELHRHPRHRAAIATARRRAEVDS